MKYVIRLQRTETALRVMRILSNARMLALNQKKTNAKNNWFKVSLHSGKNREVRKLWETESLQVSRLIRIGFGPIELPEDLKKGQYRCLEKNSVERVIKLTGMEG